MADFKDWMSLIQTVMQIISSFAVIFLTIIVDRWRRRARSEDRANKLNQEWASVNALIFSDADLLEFARRAHPYGDLDTLNIKKVYFYFSQLNTAYNSWLNARQRSVLGFVSAGICRGQAEVTFRDREFIEMHVFPRGYSADFKRYMRRIWQEIEAQGGLPLAVGMAKKRGFLGMAFSKLMRLGSASNNRKN